MTTKQILSRARRTIQNPERWTKGTFARDRRGEPVASYDKSAYQWCALGAIRKAAKDELHARLVAARALRCGIEKIGSRAYSVSSFNDYHGTDHERVLRAFDKALEECV